MTSEEKHLESLIALSQLTVEQCQKRLKEIRKTETPPVKSKRGPSQATRARIMARAEKAFTPRP